jgi:hypothetical protein
LPGRLLRVKTGSWHFGEPEVRNPDRTSPSLCLTDVRVAACLPLLQVAVLLLLLVFGGVAAHQDPDLEPGCKQDTPWPWASGSGRHTALLTTDTLFEKGVVSGSHYLKAYETTGTRVTLSSERKQFRLQGAAVYKDTKGSARVVTSSGGGNLRTWF